MILELKKGIADEKVIFGAKEILKNAKKISSAFVSADCRQEVISLLKNNKIGFEILENTKQDLANDLEIDFKCEVFGLTK